ncbi:hypothetical protein BCD67_04580 [Oscillatoriales cyanobacterium USR001]|nr:hypothetical protein BCD67_04580 [Oscillatoriales cyanobacterium USR001]
MRSQKPGFLAFLLETEDSQHSEQEERQWAMGEAENGLMLVIVFTMRGEQIRIISARKATKTERKRYEEGI